MTLTGGLQSSINKDRLVKLATIAASLGLDSESYGEMLHRASTGIDENADFDNAIVGLTDTLDSNFERRAVIYGAGTIIRTIEAPRTFVNLQLLNRQVIQFEGTNLDDIAVDYTTQAAANLDAASDLIKDVVNYYNTAANALGIAVI